MMSPFPQFKFLSIREFIKFTEKINIITSVGELEFLDRKNILKPLLILNRKKISKNYPKYQNYGFDSYNMVALYHQKILGFYPNIEYIPWQAHMDGSEERIILFYHPFQFLMLLNAKRFLNYTFPIQMIAEKDVSYIIGQIENYKNELENKIQSKIRSCIKLIPQISLFMLLQNIYNWNIGTFIGNPMTFDNLDDQLSSYLDWKSSCFDSKELLYISGFTIPEVEELYKNICQSGQGIDPLKLWFPLIQLINKDRVSKLQNNAALAQEYYMISKILKVFLYDLTQKEMPDPDDICDGSGGIWKEKVYGTEFKYYSKKTQKNIKDHYFIDPDYKTVLIIEGETEEFIINTLFKALRIDNREIVIFKIGGQGNFKWTKSALSIFTNPLDINTIIILDKDEDIEKIKSECDRIGILKKHLKIWDKDFEYDNFGIDKVVDMINDIVRRNNISLNGCIMEIDKSLIKERLKDPTLVLMKAVEIEFGKLNQKNLYKALQISKPKLSESLFVPRIKEIESEINKGNWKPKLPIEKIIEEIFFENSRWRG